MTALTERVKGFIPAENGAIEDPYGVVDAPASTTPPRSVSALDACHRAREAWERTQPQYVLDLWGDSPDHVEGHSRATGTPNLQRGERELRPAALDIFSVLNAASDTEPERGAARLASPLGRSVEGGRTERQGRNGRGSEPARAWLTAAAASHVPAHGGVRRGTPPPSTKTKQGEVAP